MKTGFTGFTGCETEQKAGPVFYPVNPVNPVCSLPRIAGGGVRAEALAGADRRGVGGAFAFNLGPGVPG